LSINKVVESDGHGAFYGLLGLSLAFILYPFYEVLLPFISIGFGENVDAAVLRLGATSVLTGLFYSVPLDRLIDEIIRYKAAHNSHIGWLRYIPTRTPHSELIRFITSVDFLTSTWRTPSWVSTEDSLDHTITSAIDDPSVQKEIWKIKKQSVVGFTFTLVSISFLGIIEEIDVIFVSGIVVGLLLLFVPWMLNSSTRLPLLTRQVAALKYAEDTFSNWIAMGQEKHRQVEMDKLKDDSKRAENLISDGQWNRLNRLYTWLTSVLERYRSRNYQVEERLYEIWARALIEIIGTKNRGEPVENVVSKYLSAVDVIKKCNKDNFPQWTQQLTAEDLTDLSKFLGLEGSWKRVDAYYPAFHHEILTVFEEISDSEMKLKWSDALKSNRIIS